MVENITSFSGGNGLRDWLIQRVTAVVLAVFGIVLFWQIFSVNDHDFTFWHTLFQGTGVRVLTLLMLLSLVVHAWIGMWTVYTDYITCSVLRLGIQVATVVGFIALFLWGVVIVWG
ncbi:MAG: succinate dehydrogenase, hydrophobic membrane anchor protein [Pseudomonadota bacterium]|nr:succinate dehydrogenase, hydrophobic membrane anchor protein [Pseudomonadota bacterium]